MVIEYSDFRISNNETLNLFHALVACHEKKATCLQFEKDTYHFSEEFAREIALCIANHGENGFKRTAFLLDGMTDFTIDGGGSHFVFDSVMNMVTALSCKNITLKNFTVSMPIAPYPEGCVISTGENYFDVKFNYHCELIIENDDLLIPNGDSFERAICNIEFNGKTHEIEFGTGDNTAGVPLYSIKKEKIAPNTIRFFDSPRIPKRGNILALMISRRYVSGLFFDSCENVCISDVTIHSCVGIGVMAQRCHNFTISNCSVSAKTGKYISTGADATHFVSCTGKIKVENCLFEHMLDDALNVHGVYVKIHKAEKGRAIVKYCNSSTTGVKLFKVGDKICQMDQHTLIPDKEATINGIREINNEFTELIFDEAIEFTKDYVIENLTAYPELLLKNCKIRNNRARGVLIATRKKCIIEGCNFHTGGSAIVLECDGSFWYESGAVMDLTIQNNSFDKCKHAIWGNGVIFIPPREKALEKQYYHGVITIKDNTFNLCFDDVLYTDNISELIYENNISNAVQNLHTCHIGKTKTQPDAKVII